MKIIRLIAATAVCTLLAMPSATKAQERLTPTVGVDFVSHYLWRGTDKGGVSIQPYGKLGWHDFSAQLWGNAGLDNDDAKELNITLGYKYKMLNVGLTDYWTSGKDFNGHDLYFEWDPVKNGHQLEANIGVDFGFLSLQAYTMVWGNDFKYDTMTDTQYRNNGKRAYSTYIEARFPFYAVGLDWDICAGATPFESACEVTSGPTILGLTMTEHQHFYADKASLILASVRATKRMEIGDVKMPVFVELHTNPYLKKASFFVGVSVQPF